MRSPRQSVLFRAKSYPLASEKTITTLGDRYMVATDGETERGYEIYLSLIHI